MARLIVHVEGQAEESFVNEVLAEYLYPNGYEIVSARLIGNARARDHRGGIKGWETVKKEIIRHLREDTGSVVTTFVDYYGLPSCGDKLWPGRDIQRTEPYLCKAMKVESGIARSICEAMGSRFNPIRFIPFVMMYEFEGLLFSDCRSFSNGIGKPELADDFQAIRDSFENPEQINDSPETAPSKRILQMIPHYEKPLLGTIAILEIGLDKIRQECPHFNTWIESLISTATQL